MIRVSNPPNAGRQSSILLAHNLRRLMARFGLGYEELVETSGLDARTIRGIIRGEKQPHARTLHRLAEALGVSTEEFFRSSTGLTQPFDQATNPLVTQTVEENPTVFDGWNPEEFAELHSRFGVGGSLTQDGVLAHAQALNERRELIDRARVVLESNEAPLLASLINLLYDRVTAPQ